MNIIGLYVFGSVIFVSLLSLMGLVVIGFKENSLRKLLIYFVSFSAGALFGDVFLHLLPEVVEEAGFGLDVSFSILSGVFFFFFLEKAVHWHHCHREVDEKHIHPFAYMNLFGDGLHNFLDGVIIAASYVLSVPAGIATTIAVALHEIPQEIGDFGVLIHGGFNRRNALIVNFASGLIALLGAGFVFWFGGFISNIEIYFAGLAAGGFLYIAGSDLIPELHKHSDSLWDSFWQLIVFVFGVLIMTGLLGVG